MGCCRRPRADLMAAVVAVLAFNLQAAPQSRPVGKDAPGMYSNYGEPDVTGLGQALGEAGAMPMEQLVPALLVAIDRLSKYSRPETVPEVRRVARERIAELACIGPCGVRAIYLPGEGVFLDERMRPEADLFDRSVLLHELVHYVQDLANERAEMEPCKRWYFRELEAYAIQKRFLMLVGSPVRVGYSARTVPCDHSPDPEPANGVYDR